MIFADYIAETVAMRLTEQMYFHILSFSETTLCENCHCLHCPFPLSDAKFPTPNDAKTPANENDVKFICIYHVEVKTLNS